MRIDQDTADTLAFFTRRSWLVMLVGVVMIGLAVVLAVVPAKSTTLTCSRENNFPVCELVEDRLWRSFRLARMPVALIRGAEAQPMPIGSSRQYFRLNLDINDGFEGPYYFAWYGDAARAQADVAALNAFLADPTIKSVKLQNDKRMPFAAIAGLLAFLGVVFVLWGSYRIQATFSRPDRRVRVTRTGLLGTFQRDFAMGEIRALEVAGLGGDCQLFVVLHSGDRIDLSSSTDTEGMMGPRRVRASRLQDADRLRTFCGLGPPPV